MELGFLGGGGFALQGRRNIGLKKEKWLGKRRTVAMMAYDHLKVEPKWQKVWDEQETFRTPDVPKAGKELEERKKFYALDMFPYPSGTGLHVGHPEGYTATDILSRYKRHQGFNVLHPMGWDAFGLPAEQYAVQTGTHPRETTKKNVDRFRSQLKRLGMSYDWNRELSTTDERYYKWTQWIFLKLFERGLAYQAEVPVNWCPELGTVLANEEVINGKSERGGFPVERRPMRQWMLRITEYAERLLEDLDTLDWPESLKTMQREWIGRSEGTEMSFDVKSHSDRSISVYTTRPETICGVSYVCLAPEYENIMELVAEGQRESVEQYIQEAIMKSDRDRTGEGATKKTGVWTGSMVINPVNGEEVPLWVADYVLGGYGTGAVMAVPAHDQRDFEFATEFDLPIMEVVTGGDISKSAYDGPGKIVNWNNALSLDLDGMDAAEAKMKLKENFAETGLGRWTVKYKLRDWLFSRQRYWGEPFPIVFVDGEPRALHDSELPLVLPDVDTYQPSGTGESPLSTIDSWVQVKDKETGKDAVRETNTMPQWAGSCWYYLRYIDPENDDVLVDRDLEKYWMPVDLYVGGVEHAVLHLLYARFWHKVLYDCGVVSTKEPFQRLVNQGIILGNVEYTGFKDASGDYVSTKLINEVDETIKRTGERVFGEQMDAKDLLKKGDSFFLKSNPEVRVQARSHKMSKSRGNVVNPDDVIQEHGADALRCYLMFMGPLEQVKPWTTTGVQGLSRFFQKVWRIFTEEDEDGNAPLNPMISENANPSKEQLAALHGTIKTVTQLTEEMKFNTALASMMEYINTAMKWEGPIDRCLLEPFVVLLSPYAPHLTEELWEKLGHSGSVSKVPWPKHNEEHLAVDEVQYSLLINGKQKLRLSTAVGLDKDAAEAFARSALKIHGDEVNGKPIKKVVFVPNKLVNFVA
ncbi:hypothetical protein NDN08_003810 [Rhodosorus marinus]|uniref:leucine--tRNA ligase n=1 Tax=Rhodosorus marinus TaxID=101924 RepID=A0AAV8UK13_9RHOD|nr:hypothetical protein NDN08_003810 [Rhodosorus marinus]